MIVQCTSCGKSVSTKICNCPYCTMEVSHQVLERASEPMRTTMMNRMKGMVMSLVTK